MEVEDDAEVVGEVVDGVGTAGAGLRWKLVYKPLVLSFCTRRATDAGASAIGGIDVIGGIGVHERVARNIKDNTYGGCYFCHFTRIGRALVD